VRYWAFLPDGAPPLDESRQLAMLTLSKNFDDTVAQFNVLTWQTLKSGFLLSAPARENLPPEEY
jgi:hypothetical protein